MADWRSLISKQQMQHSLNGSTGKIMMMMVGSDENSLIKRKQLRLFLSSSPPFNSPSSQPRLIWFQLIVSATGKPYKAATVSSVSLPSDFVIDQFRDAVQIKWNKPGYLKDIPAGALIVYKNKAAFDKRNDAEGKEEPLEEDSQISDLGKSKKEALIVVVPSRPYVDDSELPLFNELSDIVERDEWISFKGIIPPTSLKDLYIRKSYQSIAASIYNPGSIGITKAIVTGTPGIGKSLFLFYLLYKLVKDKKRVLFIYYPHIIYFDGQGGVFDLDEIPHLRLHSFWTDTLWCLFDAKGKQESDLHKCSYDMCSFVLSTSPRREMVNEFKKSGPLQVFYMPPWTEDELTRIAPLYPGATDWRQRFQILGGIPRTVMERRTNSPTDILEAACTDCSLDDCIKKVGIESTLTEKSKVIHSLIHITSTHPFTNSSVCYASQAALDIIVRNKGKEAKEKMEGLLASCEGNPLTASLCGYIFEPYAIEKLVQGGNFTCRKLVNEKKRAQFYSGETTLTIPPSEKIVVDKVLSGQNRNQLHLPKTKNYASIDAWIPGIGAFQITVGKKHDIKGGARDDLVMLGEGANVLYWLLPPLYYRDFTQKSPYDIEQYAVLIPYPDVS
jgi:hypothetical protein